MSPVATQAEEFRMTQPSGAIGWSSRRNERSRPAVRAESAPLARLSTFKTVESRFLFSTVGFRRMNNGRNDMALDRI